MLDYYRLCATPNGAIAIIVRIVHVEGREVSSIVGIWRRPGGGMIPGRFCMRYISLSRPLKARNLHK